VKHSKSGHPEKILIRGTNWIGDAVISIPAMKQLRRLFPHAHISLLVRPWVRDIYAKADFVDEVLNYDRQGIHRGWAGFYRLVSDLERRHFDLAVLLQNAFEAALLAWCARIPRRIGYARDARSFLLTNACRIDAAVRQMHQVYYYLGILSGAGLIEKRPWEYSGQDLSISVGIREEDKRAALEMLRSRGIPETQKLVGINAGASYGEAKRWLADRYAALADELVKQYGVQIVLFGSSDDLPVVKEVASAMKHSPLILAGRTSLGQLMALIKECILLITNDSGPMHLAAALDVPQIALFGSTSEKATGPLSPHAVVIKHAVECSPCFLRKCPLDFRCMKGISVQRVLEEAGKKLDEQLRGRI